MTVKIGIDARMLGCSGIGVFVENIVTELIRTNEHNHIYCLYGDVDHMGFVGDDPRVHKIPFKAPLYGIREQVLLNRRFAGEHLDLLHSPHYTVPLLYGGNLVVTVHDLIHLLFPQYLPNKLAFYYAKLMIGAAAAKARKVITDSENTKKDLLEWFNLPEDKIVVVYCAVDNIFNPDIPGEAVAGVKKKFGLDKPYLLYVGNIKPHKNISGLLQAFALVKARTNSDLQLVLVGKEFDSYSELDLLVSKLGLENDLVFTGYIETRDLPGLYKGAEVFVFPSFYEGFGIPPLEAMACGTPVITSNTSSLPEVVGDAALTVDPYQVEDIAEAILKVLQDTCLNHKLRQEGPARARRFSWTEAARLTLRVYEEIHNV